MPSTLLPLACLIFVNSSAISSDNMQNPGKIWGWIKVKAQAKNRVMEEVMSGLAGNYYYIRNIPLQGDGEYIEMFCLTPGGMEIARDIIGTRGDIRPGARDLGYSVIHFVIQGYEDSVTQVIRVLNRGGYFDYVLDYIDDFSVVGNVLKCSYLKSQCLGEVMCNFIKTAALSFHVPPAAEYDDAGPLELSSLIVHEAAHLERCYDGEEYARYQEERFKSALFVRMRSREENGGDLAHALTARLLAQSRVHNDSQRTEQTPLEEFVPPYIIEPKVIGATRLFKELRGGKSGSHTARSRTIHADQTPSLEIVVGQAL